MARQAITDEEVVGAAVLQPQGAMEGTSAYLLNVRHPEPFAELDRAHVSVTKSGFAGAAWYVLTETATGRGYHLECSRGLDLTNGNSVMKLIACGEVPEAEPTPADPDANRG